MKLTLIKGDCSKVLLNLPGNSIDLVVTSPPYNLGVDYGTFKDNLPWDKYYKWCEKWLKELFRVLKKDGRLCLNHYFSLGTSKRRESPLMTLNEIAKNIGFKHHAVAFWIDRTRIKYTAWGSWLSASAPYINSPYEGVLILYKEKWKKTSPGISTISEEDFKKGISGVWNFGPDSEKLTPSSFPIKLPKLCIELLSYKGDVVLDPFLGSGTTMKACLELGRSCIGIEINPKYIEIIKKRLNWGSTLGDVEFVYKEV